MREKSVLVQNIALNSSCWTVSKKQWHFLSCTSQHRTLEPFLPCQMRWPSTSAVNLPKHMEFCLLLPSPKHQTTATLGRLNQCQNQPSILVLHLKVVLDGVSQCFCSSLSPLQLESLRTVCSTFQPRWIWGQRLRFQFYGVAERTRSKTV